MHDDRHTIIHYIPNSVKQQTFLAFLRSVSSYSGFTEVLYCGEWVTNGDYLDDCFEVV